MLLGNGQGRGCQRTFTTGKGSIYSYIHDPACRGKASDLGKVPRICLLTAPTIARPAGGSIAEEAWDRSSGGGVRSLGSPLSPPTLPPSPISPAFESPRPSSPKPSPTAPTPAAGVESEVDPAPSSSTTNCSKKSASPPPPPSLPSSSGVERSCQRKRAEGEAGVVGRSSLNSLSSAGAA